MMPIAMLATTTPGVPGADTNDCAQASGGDGEGWWWLMLLPAAVIRRKQRSL